MSRSGPTFSNTFGVCFSLVFCRCSILRTQNASETMFSVDSASARSTEIGIKHRFLDDQVGIRFFSSCLPSKMLAFLSENTTLGPPEQSLVFVRLAFFSDAEIARGDFGAEKVKKQITIGECNVSSFSAPFATSIPLDVFPTNCLLRGLFRCTFFVRVSSPPQIVPVLLALL